MKEEKLPKVEVRGDGIHGKSLFLKEDVKKGQKIIEYIGEKITKKEAERRIDKIDEKVRKTGKPSEYYIFELNKTHDIDGDVSWNKAKYVNHSCDPNCEIDIIRGHIWVLALRDIARGEELSYDYAWDIDDEYADRPCLCGSPHCVGYIMNDKKWPYLVRRLQKEGKLKEAARVERAIIWKKEQKKKR